MGKQGPCCHCGVTSTPLWRNGPPEKPVLCNACGSRWRTKGTLTNYIPLHARLDQDEVNRVPRAKNVYINKNKEVKLVKNNTTYDLARVVHDNIQSFGKVLEEDTSNRSSSGSAISFSESCAQIDCLDASELTGPHQSNVWDSVVPSKKRTCIGRPKQSPIEKLTKDLYAIMHKQQSSYFSGSSEDLIFESETPMVSVEIGHGSVLIRHPSSIFQDEESEASSLTIENKPCPGNEVYSHSKNHSVHNESKSFNIPSPVSEKSENSTGEGMQKKQVKKNELQHETAHILESPNSLLCSIDLNDVLNFELFSSKLSDEEQQQLLKYLSSADSTALPDSLQDMFESHQLKESISSLQQRLAEGVFDLSFDGKETDDSKTLKRLKLSSLSTAEWVEQYHLLKKQEENTSRCLAMEARNAAESTNVVGLKRSHETLTQNGPETKTIKSPKRIASYGNKEFIDNDGSCFSPRQLFALPSDGSSSTLHGLNFVGESSDQDLLLEVPSNGSFPQAELLNPTLSYDQQANTGRSSTYRM